MPAIDAFPVEAWARDSFAAARQSIDRFPNTEAQLALTDFMERRAYAKHVLAMRELYAERHTLLQIRIARAWATC